MIEISGLSKKYGAGYAIKNLNFKIEDGLIYGFLGPNGAGKSTTMNIITGYLSATEGTVAVNGCDILKEPEEAKRHIGYLPETPPLYPEMTVREYLDFAAELKKVPHKERREHIQEIMELTGLSEMEDRLIRNLSKGYKQRVGMAQAMVAYPDVIILDEPTVGLDPKQIIEIRDLIRELKREHTVILSSHILSEVSAVCDRILIIAKGRLVAEGTPEELERMMQGENELLIEARADEKRLSDALNEFEEIEGYEISEASALNRKNTDEETSREAADINELHDTEPKLIYESSNPSASLLSARIRIKEDAEIRDRLSLKLAEYGIPVYSLMLNEKSLEDIFLELTESETEISEARK